MIRALAATVAILMAYSLAGAGPPEANNPPRDRSESAPAGIDYSRWPSVTPVPFRVPSERNIACAPRGLPRGPHAARAIKVFTDPTAREHLMGNRPGALPVGATVVKEKLADVKADHPVAYAAMIKREAGYDPKHGDWEYVYEELGERGRVQRGRLANCIECHAIAASKDYLFRTYLKFAPPKR